MKGYMGKIARIDLTSGKASIEELKEEVARKYLGGKGLGAYLLYYSLRPHTEPCDPGNILIFAAGPLTGTSFPTASRGSVITRSPLTGTFLDSYAGGLFGPCIKYSGFDGLMITGKATSPVYLVVDNGRCSIHDARHLWGLSTSETETRLIGELKQADSDKMSIASVGPGAENGVRFSGIVTDRRMFGRGGAGTVMGSKNLKAIVLKGENRIEVADESGFKTVVKSCQQKIAEHPMTKRGGQFRRFGTMDTVDLTQETGTLPTRNWQENTFDHAEQITGTAFLKYVTRSRACYLCPIGCSRDTKALVGGSEYITEGPEYETIFAFGSNCAIEDPSFIIAADKLCDEYGIDSISCGGVIGFAMECFEKGLLSKKETGGIDLSFGNGKAVLELIHLIGKREGIGRLLSEGVKIASEKIEGSSRFAMHVKGLEPPGYDPRGMKGQALTYALSDRGACHLRSNTLRTELLGLPQPVDRYGYEGKAAMVRELQLTYVIFDSLIGCAFGGFAITQKDYVDGVAALTGWPFILKELRQIAERTWNLTRLFNVREGFTRKDDTLPLRLFEEASSKGPSKGQVVDRIAFEKMLDEYYQIVGWDTLTGRPTEKKLIELGIESLG
jgi:aldehyde:ferredoxin oxidoreductase